MSLPFTPDTDRKNILNRSKCSPVVQINADLNIIGNGIVMFQHGRPGIELTRHRYCGGMR